jgi:NhaP-type Na+/H+ or K+/H+ antiporter
MAQRIAGACALVVFAICLWAGANAGNPFTTVVYRALVAMIGTLVIGLIIGVMAQKMLDENLNIEEEKLKNDSVKSNENGR